MLLRAIEESLPLDEIVFFDTGWEFPGMIEHIDKVEQYIDMPITRLSPHIDFTHWMLNRPIVARKGPMKGEVHRTGNGWPSFTRRWCTREKCTIIDRHCGKDSARYIGFAADEYERMQSFNAQKINARYPLIEWLMSEADCMQYCRDRGFDWGGLYDVFSRVSCFCCPLQRIGELRNLRRHFPELWTKMLSWDREVRKKDYGQFMKSKSVADLDRRFAEEDSLAKVS